MTMGIEWTPDLAVGLDEIDEQHKELYRRIDKLMDACQQGKGKEVVADTLNFLEEYVVTHFSNEEGYMQRFGYPDYEVHKRNHAYYVNNLKELKDLLAEKGPGVELVVRTNVMVIEWLNNHIRKMDTKMAAFLSGKI